MYIYYIYILYIIYIDVYIYIYIYIFPYFFMCVSPTVPNSTMVTRRLSNELSSHARMEGSSHTSTCPNRSWICPRLIWSDCLYLGWKIWASSAKWFGKPADSILKFSKPTMVRFQTWSRTFFVGVCWRFGFCFFFLPILKRWIYQMPGQAGVLDHEGSATVLFWTCLSHRLPHPHKGFFESQSLQDSKHFFPPPFVMSFAIDCHRCHKLIDQSQFL